MLEEQNQFTESTNEVKGNIEYVSLSLFMKIINPLSRSIGILQDRVNIIDKQLQSTHIAIEILKHHVFKKGDNNDTSF